MRTGPDGYADCALAGQAARQHTTSESPISVVLNVITRISSDIKSVDPKGVVAQQLALGLGLEPERLDLGARTLEVEDREVGAEQHLVLAVAVDEAHERLGPVL